MTFLQRRRRTPVVAFALFLLLSSKASAFPFLHHSDPTGGKQQRPRETVDDTTASSGANRALRPALRGIGSSPPSCRSKCGNCMPCTPVHVPIQPGFSMPMEYYPEAWRCKCGNKLFMP